ncbi:MAG: hypothetical protein IKQ45_04210 [Clostridia bacterium]|nr:hypothetical protein [Clostridia bacterium]
MRLRKILCAILWAVVLLLWLPVCNAAADSVTYQGITVDRETETVDLGDLRVVNYREFYEFLEQLPNLKQVDMFATAPGQKLFAEMHEKFPGVDFGVTLAFGDRRLRTDDTAFSTLYNEGGPVYGYKQLSVLRYCRNLYALDIGHNPVGNLDFLYDLPELRVLIVALCNLTDITPIASLEHLEYLEIFHNNISDVSCLSGLNHLMDLNLVRNRVQDLSPLAEIKSLQRLWIHWSDFKDPNAPDPEAVAALRAALPDCRIDEVSTSTGGGWRKHPHFDVIYRMFRLRKYEPFEDSDPENLPEPWRSERLDAENAP